VAFIHGKDPEKAQKVFERREVRVSFREGGTQIRAGAALFNNNEDVARFLEAAEELRRL
jgi:selenocysteine lyase/cysteine desulfurase